MIETIVLSVISSGALYAIGKFIRNVIKKSKFKSSCMINHEAEATTNASKED